MAYLFLTRLPCRASIEGLEGEIFKFASHGATPKLWNKWPLVLLAYATAVGDRDLVHKLKGTGKEVPRDRGSPAAILFASRGRSAAQGGIDAIAAPQSRGGDAVRKMAHGFSKRGLCSFPSFRNFP